MKHIVAASLAPARTLQPTAPRIETRKILFGYIDSDGISTIVTEDQGTLNPLAGMLLPSGGLTDETFDELFDAKPGDEVLIYSTTGMSSKTVRKMTDHQIRTYAEIYRLSLAAQIEQVVGLVVCEPRVHKPGYQPEKGSPVN